jgi:hypothetical protein
LFSKPFDVAVGNLACFFQSAQHTMGMEWGRLNIEMMSACIFHPDILEGTLLESFLLSLLTQICFNYTILSLSFCS